jgi:hypothetical protein
MLEAMSSRSRGVVTQQQLATPLSQQNAGGLHPIAEVVEHRFRKGNNEWYSNEGESMSSNSDYHFGYHN